MQIIMFLIWLFIVSCVIYIYYSFIVDFLKIKRKKKVENIFNKYK